MKSLLPGFLALTAFGAQPAGELTVGARLPQLRGEFLSGRSAVLPDVASERFALLLLGFTYNSRFAVEPWAARFSKQFHDNPRVTFFEIPMIGGMARMGKWFIDSGMRRGTPKEDYERVITVYGGTDAWKARVGFSDPNAAYLILIDGEGKVLWRYAGGFDEKAYDALAAEIPPVTNYMLRRESWVPRPLSEVFEFFAQAENLERLTPPWLRFRIETPRPIRMHAGATIAYALRVRGIPVHWMSLIEEWNPPFEFIDVQVKGPYKLWRHTHRFTEANGGTSIVDSVEYALPFGVLGRIVNRLQVSRDLAKIFDYRAQQVQKLFP